MTKPNILYIHSHDTGRYISPYGYGLPTPAFEKLAEGGVLFRQHHTSAPTCSPSRASLVTGQCAHSCGMLGLAHRGHSLNDYSHHIIHTLKEEGYHSALVGFQHVADFTARKDIGYDEEHWFDGAAEPTAEKAAAVLAERKAAGQPFFLSVGFTDTHRPFPDVPAEEAEYFKAPDPLPDTPETRRDMAGYYERLKKFDSGTGLVLDKLEELGLAENTLVICTTDHGIPFPFMKCNLTDHGTGIMLIMRGPGGFTGGKTVDGMTSHEDIFPTICELAGIDIPDRVEGSSLLPLVGGGKKEIHEELYGEVTYHAAYEPMRSVRTKRWKYIRRYDGRTKPVLPNIDQGLSKTLMLENGLADRQPAAEQLYDLLYDPNETDSLAADPAYSDTLKEMRGRLKSWMERTGDPLLAGSVHVKGAVVNDVDGLDPEPGTVKVLE